MPVFRTNPTTNNLGTSGVILVRLEGQAQKEIMKNDPAKIVLVVMIGCGVIGCALGIGFGLHIAAIPFMAVALVLALALNLN